MTRRSANARVEALAMRLARWKDRDPAIDLSPNEMLREVLRFAGITVTEEPAS